MSKNFLQKILASLSKKILAKYKPKVVGITGSVGKTTAKDMTAAVLAGRFRVGTTSKNNNNEIGVPLAIIGVHDAPGSSLFAWIAALLKGVWLLVVRNNQYPEVLVLEMGADKPGDIKYLVELAPCTVGVLTWISHAHTEFFKTLKQIAEEKKKILSHLEKTGTAVINFDNELVRETAAATKATVITYGFKDGAELQASDVKIMYDPITGWPSGINCKINFKGHSVPLFFPGVIAEHIVGFSLAALAVGDVFSINLVEAAEALTQAETPKGRMRLLKGIKNTLLIDDTYNSSPDAAKSALKTLAHLQNTSGGKRYAVLGDMLELGPETEIAHREVGFAVAEAGVDFLITVGEASKITCHAAAEAGLSENQIAAFADSGAAGKFLQEKIKAGDIILVKGSQGVRMERVVKEVMNDPLEAPNLLVRQTKEWN
jgi:UDP-N-acetylmuramoyl-tripeptide--D-alanyl-D-alanine ligase